MRKKLLRKEFLSSALILVGALMLLPVVSNAQTQVSSTATEPVAAPVDRKSVV